MQDTVCTLKEPTNKINREMKRMVYKGVFPVLVTPFTDSGDLDIESMRNLVRFELDSKVDGLTILGITSEAHKLQDEEREKIIGCVVDEVNSKIPVVVGCGHFSTEIAIKLSKKAQDIGADATMVYPQQLLKPNPNAVIEHYKKIRSKLDIEIVIQDEPNFAKVHMDIETIKKLSDLDFKYIKLEDAPTPHKISEIRKNITREMTIFGGLGGVFCLEELFRGANGIMTGFAYPEILKDIYCKFISGEINETKKIFYKYLPLIRYEAQPQIGLSIRKEIYRIRKIINSSYCRKPSLNADEITIKELNDLIVLLGLGN